MSDSIRSTPTGGAAVSSGNTSAFGLPILRAPTPAPERDPAAFDGLDLPVDAVPAKRSPAAPAPAAVEPEPLFDGGMFAGLDLAEDEPTPPRRDASVVGSITGLFRRCREWLAESEKPRRPATDETPRGGVTVIGFGGSPARSEPSRDQTRERAVRAAARVVAPTTPKPMPADARERIVEKRRMMLELQRQREQEARDELVNVTIVRKPMPPNRPAGA